MKSPAGDVKALGRIFALSRKMQQQRKVYQEHSTVGNLFAQLPDELVLLIFEHLVTYTSDATETTERVVPTSTFRNLTMTCRSFYTIATPFLYSKYDGIKGNFRLPFLKIVASKPGLADCVQDMTIQGIHGDFYHMLWHSMDVDAAIESEICGLNVPYKQRWLEQLKKKPQDVRIALLVLRARNLETLKLVHCMQCQTGHSDRRLPIFLQPITESTINTEAPCEVSNRYEKLRHLHIDLAGLSVEQIGQLLLLPALSSLVLGSATHNPFLHSYMSPIKWPVPLRSSKLENIVLTNSSLPPEALSKLIQSCRALKNFLYVDWFIPKSTGARWYADTIAALDEHRPTLERVGFTTTGNDKFEGVFSACRILNAMPHLKLLRVDFRLLLPRIRELNADGNTPRAKDLLSPHIESLFLVVDQAGLPVNGDYQQAFRLLVATRSVQNSLEIEYRHRRCTTEFLECLVIVAACCLVRDVSFVLKIKVFVDNTYEWDAMAGQFAGMGKDGLYLAQHVELDRRCRYFRREFFGAVKAWQRKRCSREVM